MLLTPTLLSIVTLSVPLLAAPTANDKLTPLQRRQTATAGLALECRYTEIADEAKKQVYKHTQVTENTVCAQDDCVSGKSTSHSFGIEASVGVDLISGVTGSAGITEEWTSGEDHQCYAGPGETVCVWLKTAYSVYDVSIAEGRACTNDESTIGKS